MAYSYPDLIREDILGMIPPDGKIIGSIGCGMGATEAKLVERGCEVHGVDVSEEAIKVAAGRLTSARVISPSERSPFARESLDGLILADVIEHIPLAAEALKSFVAAVRPGGWVVISVPNMRHLEMIIQLIWKGDWPEHSYGIFDATHVQVMTHKRLERWCRNAGLRIVRWFDRYDPHGPRRYRFYRTLDLITLRLLKKWWMYQLQVVCRKDAAVLPADKP